LRCHKVTISSSIIDDSERRAFLCCVCTSKLEMWFEGKNIPYGLHDKHMDEV